MACCLTSVSPNIQQILEHKDLKDQTDAMNNQWSETNERLSTIESQICKWAPPTYGHIGEDWQKTFWQLAMIAVATINTIAQISIAQKQYKIAKDYANLASEKWERFKDHYAPLERAMVNEAGNTPKYNPDYEGARQRGNGNAQRDYNTIQTQLAGLASQYGLCVDLTFLDDLNLIATVAADDGTNWGYRDEENFAIYKDDLRWNRRSTMLNLGRDIHSISASYADTANKMLASLRNTLNQGASGAMSLLGYLSEYRNTQYPALFSMASPLGGQSGLMGDVVFSGPTVGGPG